MDDNRLLNITKSLALIIPVVIASGLSVYTFFKGEPGAKMSYAILSKQTNELQDHIETLEKNVIRLQAYIEGIQSVKGPSTCDPGYERSNGQCIPIVRAAPAPILKFEPKPEKLPDNLEAVQQQQAL